MAFQKHKSTKISETHWGNRRIAPAQRAWPRKPTVLPRSACTLIGLWQSQRSTGDTCELTMAKYSPQTQRRLASHYSFSSQIWTCSFGKVLESFDYPGHLFNQYIGVRLTSARRVQCCAQYWIRDCKNNCFTKLRKNKAEKSNLKYLSFSLGIRNLNWDSNIFLNKRSVHINMCYIFIRKLEKLHMVFLGILLLIAYYILFIIFWETSVLNKLSLLITTIIYIIF